MNTHTNLTTRFENERRDNDNLRKAKIDLVVELEMWKNNKILEYEEMGDDGQTTRQKVTAQEFLLIKDKADTYDRIQYFSRKSSNDSLRSHHSRKGSLQQEGEERNTLSLGAEFSKLGGNGKRPSLYINTGRKNSSSSSIGITTNRILGGNLGTPLTETPRNTPSPNSSRSSYFSLLPDYHGDWQEFAIQLGLEERVAKIFSVGSLIGFVKQELPIIIQEHASFSNQITRLIKLLEKINSEHETYRLVAESKVSVAESRFSDLMEENNDNLEKLIFEQRKNDKLEKENRRLNEQLTNQAEEFQREIEKKQTAIDNQQKRIEDIKVKLQ